MVGERWKSLVGDSFVLGEFFFLVRVKRQSTLYSGSNIFREVFNKKDMYSYSQIGENGKFG